MTSVSQQRRKSRPERGLSHIVRSLCEAASRNKPRQLRDGLKDTSQQLVSQRITRASRTHQRDKSQVSSSLALVLGLWNRPDSR